ncbi:MAG: tetratricopeptide repeat protein [Planctomycetota bacterium]
MGCGLQSHRAEADKHARLAEQQYSRQNLDKALEHVERAVALDPGQASYLVMRAQMLGEKGELDQARRDFERALTLEPDHPGTIIPNAVEKMATGQNEEARDLLERSSRRNPGQEELLWFLGLSELRLEEQQTAEATFSRLLDHAERSGSSHQVHGRVGRALASPSGSDQAVSDWTYASSASADMTLETALQLVGLGLGNRVRSVAAEAAKAHPENVDLGFVHATILQRTSFSDQAVAEAERVLALEPGNRRAIDLHMTAAAADGDRMRFAAARERLRVALDLEPTALPALVMLAEAVVTGRGTPDDLEDLLTRIENARKELASSPRAMFILDQIEQQLRAARR